MASPSVDAQPNAGRREFLEAAAVTLAAFAAPAHAAESSPPTGSAFPFEEATLAQLDERLRNGQATAKALVEAYLARIAAIDRAGPRLRAVIEVNPEAVAIAEALDAERKTGKVRGALHGIPVLLKDNIATGDRLHTTAGSLALAGLNVREDAGLVKRLRAAGAIILGKANLSEWANFRSTHAVSGWSSVGGQTRNPYALDRSPSGSSSGCAVAVTANLCAAAIGTETDGSIVSPSSCNGIVGLKPTVGVVSRAGIVPISRSQDCAGPMARTVADCALLMNVMAHREREDESVDLPPPPSDIDYTAFLGRADLRGVRLGFPRQFAGLSEKGDAIVGNALRALQELGAEIVELEVPAVGRFGSDEIEVLFFEFKDGINRWLARHARETPMKSLDDLIEFNRRHADKVMPFFGQDAFIRASQKGPLTSPAYRTSLARCRSLARAQGIDAAVRNHRVDALVSMTSQPSWLLDPINGEAPQAGCTSLAAVSGYPHLTVPAGFAHGLPVGLSFIGPAYSDAKLLGIGDAFERATRHRRAPTFAKTVSPTL